MFFTFSLALNLHVNVINIKTSKNHSCIQHLLIITHTKSSVCNFVHKNSIASCYTSSSAVAEGPRDALVSRNSATTKHPILKNRVPGLSCGIICVILRLAVFTQYRSVIDTHTHRRTDIASRGKNRPYCTPSIITRQRASVDSKF